MSGAGSCTITASQAGDTNYDPAPDVVQTFAIAKANQTITFGALAAKTFGDADFAVSGTASTSPPVVVIVTPRIDDFIASSPVVVQLQAVDAVGVTSVNVNGVVATPVAGTAQNGLWQASVPVSLPVPTGGALVFIARANDQAGNLGSATTIVDNDGIPAAIDRNVTTGADQSGAYSNDFSDVPSGERH